MAKYDPDMIGKLAEGLTRTQRLVDGVALAGNGLLLPLATLRSRSARRELRRIEARMGEKSPEAQRQAKHVTALARRENDISAELARRFAPFAEMGDGEASLAGRITRDGTPLIDLAVVVLDEGGKTLRQSCTGREGRYALALPAGIDLRIELREEGKRLFRDKEGFAYPPGYAAVRDIEIRKADPVCDPSDPVPTDAIQMPMLEGLHLDRAKRTIDALGLKLAKVEEKPSNRPGVVLAQDPPAGAKVVKAAEISLIVGTKEGWAAGAVGDLTGKSLAEGLKAIEAAHVALAAVTILNEGGQTPTIRAAIPNASGDAMHLEVAVTGGNAATLGVVAAVLAASEDARALGLDSATKAGRWMAEAKIASLEDLAGAVAEDDIKLRGRLSLGSEADVASQRKALLSVLMRIRKG